MENVETTDTAAAVKTLPSIKVVLVDFGGTGLTHDGLVACAAALQIQMQHDYAAAWGVGAGLTVRAATSALDIRDDEILGGAFEHPDIAQALGYHDVAKNGQPIFKSFPRLDEQDGVPWQPTMSHELIEILGDWFCWGGIQARDGKWWAPEHADAVESDTYNITVNGVAVPVSNFVRPEWYGAKGSKHDFLGKLSAPFTCTPGGYSQFYTEAGGWQQIFAQHADGSNVSPRAYRVNYAGRFARRVAAGKVAA